LILHATVVAEVQLVDAHAAPDVYADGVTSEASKLRPEMVT
jgi:hypothetical protein